MRNPSGSYTSIGSGSATTSIVITYGTSGSSLNMLPEQISTRRGEWPVAIQTWPLRGRGDTVRLRAPPKVLALMVVGDMAPL